MIRSCLLLTVLACGWQACAGDATAPPTAGRERLGPVLERGDYPESLAHSVAEVLRPHRFTAPWIVVKGSEESTWFIVERIESAHRFDRLFLRVASDGEATASITPYQFGPSDWASLGKLFADFGPEAKEIAAAVAKGAHPVPRIPSHPGYTLELHFDGKPLAQAWVEKLYAKAVEILESSNFNSRAPRWQWNMPEVHQQYRQTVAGKYLLISFKEPNKFTTVGGEVTAKEIIIGLNGRQYASALFMIDDEDRLVGHAKYSGPLCVEFLKLVKVAVDQ